MKRRHCHLVLVAALLLVSAGSLTAQTPNPDGAWTAAFDRLDRTSRSIIDGIRCVQDLATARTRGVFGRDADEMQEWACVRQENRQLGIFLTFDSTVTRIVGLAALDRAAGTRFTGPIDSGRVIAQSRAEIRTLQTLQTRLGAGFTSMATVTLRSDGDSIEVWLLPMEALRARPMTLGGERAFIYGPDGRTAAREVDATTRLRTVSVPDTGLITLQSRESELPLVSELIAANRLDAMGLGVSIRTGRTLSALAGGAAWIHVRGKTATPPP